MNIKIKILILVLVSISLTACPLSKGKNNQQTIAQEIVKPKYELHEIYIPKGGSLFSEMTSVGLTPQQIIEITLVFGDNVDFRMVQPNDHFQVLIDPVTNEVMEFNYIQDIVTTHKLVRDIEAQTYNYILDEKEFDKKMLIVEGVLYTTLEQALNDHNVEPVVKYAVMNALSSKVNFSAYARIGDTFKIMYEERYFQGIRVPGSRLYYISYNGKSTGFHEGYRYDEGDDKSAYNGMYTPLGHAMLVAPYRLPLDRIHVTSPYGNRFHPITRKWRMHSGVDYRGATGTPVYAVSSGRVILARKNGGFGNTVEVLHENGYVTQYAHLHRIRVKHGQRVSMGSVVGTVGSTGASTGPHLHFGLRINGRYVNPGNLKMASATKLKGNRLEKYKKQISEIKTLIINTENEPDSPYDMTLFEKYRRANAKIS
ncbi:MAG: M23 family metallopeptidase [Candidatus Cloacimonetes bacterium]|jgi:murein DD-endopeptidase MepM/ murein hydrolase activator NlpD|nr:M23 family metallopeptidase [Candidatus Cloacimonadota bacterium]